MWRGAHVQLVVLRHPHEIWFYEDHKKRSANSFFAKILYSTLLLLRTFTFWRFMIEVPLSSHEMKINYTINGGMELAFFVPGRNQNMRSAAYSVSLTSWRFAARVSWHTCGYSRRHKVQWV